MSPAHGEVDHRVSLTSMGISSDIEPCMVQRILVIDDEESLLDALSLAFATEGHEVLRASTREQAFSQIQQAPIDAVLCDLRMPGCSGLELLPELSTRIPGVPIILMSAYGDDDLVIQAMQRGAYDYLAKPFSPSEALLTIRKAKERESLRTANRLLQRDVQRAVGLRPIVAASDLMVEVLELIEKAAEFKATVLLTGESGTGKEILARAIHSQSDRRNMPFVAVNCAAIPESLVESELFGHAKGAFTGADRARRGFFLEANNGTLFLDEVAELPVASQATLLRAIQEEEIQPLGQSKSRKVNVRLIAATAQDIGEAVSAGRFREDLYYRLNVLPIQVPPLRNRPKDIPLLVDHYLAAFSESLGKPMQRVSDAALALLVRYSWPGNVRELQNIMERAVILAKETVIGIDDLPHQLKQAPQTNESPHSFSLKAARRRFEKEWIRKALDESFGNRTHAAKLLEISHRALLYKLREYKIED